ncbi:MAG: flagellar motor protein MotA [Alphaproteobacteria bacterium]|nr:flagellar motor protein MotA [Alphaproteobacteria bacterium]
MTFVSRSFIKMLLFVGFIATGITLLFGPLYGAFKHNPVLNTVIFSIFVVGVLVNFLSLYRIQKEQRWLASYDRGHERFPGTPEPKILTPVALIFNESKNHYLSPILVRSLLASVDARLDAMRDVSRYIIGLLIFMGLLGTFWGLSQTIGAIAGVISGIDLGVGDVKEAFSTLKQGLQSPLSGMGTAFSCSMFGLGGSLIVGFLDLQISRLATEFYHCVEDRLTLLTKVSTADSSDAVHSGPAYLHGLLEQTAENMNQLQNLIRRGEDNRTSVIKSMQGVGEKLTVMTDQMLTNQQLLKKIAENQIDLQGALQQFYKVQQHSPNDDAIKHHMRSMDATLSKILEESIDGRSRSTQDLRNEIRLVARTISALADGQEVAA